MEAKYSGPDTGGKMTYMRSGLVPPTNVNAGKYFSLCDPASQEDVSQFMVCIFRSEIALSQIPIVSQADTGANRLYYVGKGNLRIVDITSVDQFRSIIPNTPDNNYAWAISGTLKIAMAGSYTLCIESDDG